MIDIEIKNLLSKLENSKPISAEIQNKLDQKFRLEFNYNSNHLEGSTLTYGETKLLLFFGKTNGNHEFREYQEMGAHDAALRLIKEWALDENFILSENDIRNLNQIILVEPFWKDALSQNGEIVKRQIEIGSYKRFLNCTRLNNGEIFEYASVLDTPILMQELLQWYHAKETQELDPALIAALLHYKFVKIHPFDDGNGRIARLLMNYVLFKNNLPPIIIKSSDKKNYLDALNQADSGNIEAFINYILTQLKWSLELTIKAANGEEIDEEDDLSKKIELLKRKIQIVKRKEEDLTNLTALWNDIISNFVEKYLDKFSTFGNLFTNHWLEVVCQRTRGAISIFTCSPNDLNDLNKLFNSDEGANNISSIIIFFHFQKEKRLNFNMKHKLVIEFTKEGYLITLEDFNIVKKYNEIVSEKEINNITKLATENFLKQIENNV